LARVNKYCFDCGTRLTYLKELSTPKLPNEFRHMAYTCEKCNDKNDVETDKNFIEPQTKIIMVNRQFSKIPVETVRIQLTEFRHASENQQKGIEKQKAHWDKMKIKKEAIEAKKEWEQEQLSTST